MEISSSARLALAHVDRDPSVAEHDANKSYLLFSAPAPDAGTDRDGHRIRLTPHGAVGIPSPLTPLKRRLPSPDSWRMLFTPNLAAFLVSRRLAMPAAAASTHV